MILKFLDIFQRLFVIFLRRCIPVGHNYAPSQRFILCINLYQFASTCTNFVMNSESKTFWLQNDLQTLRLQIVLADLVKEITYFPAVGNLPLLDAKVVFHCCEFIIIFQFVLHWLHILLQVLNYFDMFFTAVFTLEITLKVSHFPLWNLHNLIIWWYFEFVTSTLSILNLLSHSHQMRFWTRVYIFGFLISIFF